MHYLSVLLKDALQSTCENGNLSQATVKYFGKEVGKGKVGPLQAKVLTIESFPPSTEKGANVFLRALIDMLKGSTYFEWTIHYQRAFDHVK